MCALDETCIAAVSGDVDTCTFEPRPSIVRLPVAAMGQYP